MIFCHHFPQKGLSSGLQAFLHYTESLVGTETFPTEEEEFASHWTCKNPYQIGGSRGTEGAGPCHCKGTLSSLRWYGDWERVSVARKANIIIEDLENYPTLVHRKAKQWIPVEGTSRYTEDMKVVGNSQHGFSKGVLCPPTKLLQQAAQTDVRISILEDI